MFIIVVAVIAGLALSLVIAVVLVVGLVESIKKIRYCGPLLQPKDYLGYVIYQIVLILIFAALPAMAIYAIFTSEIP